MTCHELGEGMCLGNHFRLNDTSHNNNAYIRLQATNVLDEAHQCLSTVDHRIYQDQSALMIHVMPFYVCRGCGMDEHGLWKNIVDPKRHSILRHASTLQLRFAVHCAADGPMFGVP